MVASRPLLAVSCAVGASLFFSINDMGIKFLSGDYALHQIILIRAVAALVFTLAILVPLEGGWRILKTRRPGMHLVRGFLVVASNMFFFLGLASVSLAEATAIFFVAPLLITAMSVLFLNEVVGWPRWTAIAVGLLGVVIMLRPGTDAFQPAALLPILAALTYAALVLTTRVMRLSETASTMTFYVQLAFVVASGAFGLAFGDGAYAGTGIPSLEFLLRMWQPLPFGDVAIIVGVGAMSAFGGYLFTRAYANAEAGLVAPFEYTALIMAILWGILVFGEWPDRIAFLGMSLILASGLFVIWRETRRGPMQVEHPRPSVS
jgi:drug/metabolite transporter (DMT)-like permease